jgi:hypothetical protein
LTSWCNISEAQKIFWIWNWNWCKHTANITTVLVHNCIRLFLNLPSITVTCTRHLSLYWCMSYSCGLTCISSCNSYTNSSRLCRIEQPNLFLCVFYVTLAIHVESNRFPFWELYKVVQIWPGLILCKLVTVCPGHIWTTLYITDKCIFKVKNSYF